MSVGVFVRPSSVKRNGGRPDDGDATAACDTVSRRSKPREHRAAAASDRSPAESVAGRAEIKARGHINGSCWGQTPVSVGAPA